jgi:hypothetical protein
MDKYKWRRTGYKIPSNRFGKNQGSTNLYSFKFCNRKEKLFVINRLYKLDGSKSFGTNIHFLLVKYKVPDWK